MARHDWFHPGLYLFLVLAFSLSMVSISDGQSNTLFKFHPYIIEFTQERLERFLRCLCTARTSTCQQDYSLTSYLNYTAQGNVRSENISANEKVGNTFRCYPGAFTPTMAFIDCVRSSDPLVHCEKEYFCQPYFVNLDYEGCDSKCINIWWVAREVEITNVAGYPAFVAGSCEPSGSSPSAGNNDGNNDGKNGTVNHDVGNNDSNYDGNNDADNNDGNDDSNDDADTTDLMVAAALGWLFFGFLAGSALAFLYCWRCRKTFVIHKMHQLQQKNTKFVASEIRSLPSGYGQDQPASQQGRGNVNKINGHRNRYTDYNEVNDEYTVIDDEKMPNVKKEITKTKDVEPAYKNVLPHSPSGMSEDNSLTTINGYIPMTIKNGDVGHRNKRSIERTEACARLQTDRSAADPRMSKGAMLIYDIPSGTLANNGKASIDLERPGLAEDAVNRSVDPYNIAPAAFDEVDDNDSHHYKSPPIRNTGALEG